MRTHCFTGQLPHIGAALWRFPAALRRVLPQKCCSSLVLLLLLMLVMLMEINSAVPVQMSKLVVPQMSLEVSLSVCPPEQEYSNHQVAGC